MQYNVKQSTLFELIYFMDSVPSFCVKNTNKKLLKHCILGTGWVPIPEMQFFNARQWKISIKKMILQVTHHHQNLTELQKHNMTVQIAEGKHSCKLCKHALTSLNPSSRGTLHCFVYCIETVARFEVLTMVLLIIQAFWDVTLYYWLKVPIKQQHCIQEDLRLLLACL